MDEILIWLAKYQGTLSFDKVDGITYIRTSIIYNGQTFYKTMALHHIDAEDPKLMLRAIEVSYQVIDRNIG